LNHIIGNEIKKRGSKIYAFFVDLKAAFDNVERYLLWEYLRKKGINEHLATKIEEIYEETISRVRVD
jgi:hypothetical protein